MSIWHSREQSGTDDVWLDQRLSCTFSLGTPVSQARVLNDNTHECERLLLIDDDELSSTSNEVIHGPGADSEGVTKDKSRIVVADVRSEY